MSGAVVHARAPVALLALLSLSISCWIPGAARAAGSPGDMGPAPASLAQSWVAGFHLSGHFFHPGDVITGTIDVKVGQCLMSWAAKNKQCYQGTDWRVAGAACPPMALTCSWKAGAGSDAPSWKLLAMPIGNTIGPAESDDYYAVVDKDTFVLDGHVLDKTGNPIAGVSVDINGPKNRHLATDATGYYNAFLPRGAYTVAVSTGSPLDDQWFRPRTKSVDLQRFATVDFTGSDHTAVQFKDHSLLADGLHTTTVTVMYLNPVNQPVPNQALRIDTSGPKVLLCSAMPRLTGRIAPTDLVNGEPLNLPATTATDAQGTLTFQVYAGTESGTLDIAADSAANTVATDTSSFSHDSLELKSPPWLSTFPNHFKLSYRTSNGSLIHAEDLTTLLWEDLHGKVLGEPPSPYRDLGGSALDKQKFMLQWIANDFLAGGYEGAGLAGVEIAPISGSGGSNPAVLLFLHGHRGDNANTRVIDANLFNALVDATSPDDILPELPTLSAWTAIAGGAVIPDYAQATAEQGLTYGGFPYLPGSESAEATFRTDCLQRAQ